MLSAPVAVQENHPEALPGQRGHRVAEREPAAPRMVVRPSAMPPPAVPPGSGVLQRCGGKPCDCAAEGESHEGMAVQAKSSGTAGRAAPSARLAPSRVNAVLNSSQGHRLDGRLMAALGPALGHDFASVRVHAGTMAAESAAAVGADAYTVGNDIVFGAGKYQPASPAGERLIAHELVHVVQQHRSGQPSESPPQLAMSDPDDAGEREAEAISAAVTSGQRSATITAAPRTLQRACRDALGKPDPECKKTDTGAGGWTFMFKVGCDELLPGEEANISKLKAGSTLHIHGYASKEGPEPFNWDLSCHRANRIAKLARDKRPDCPVADTFMHGPSPVSGPGIVPDPHPLPFWRMVIVEESKPDQKDACGPDATDWLIAQIVAAKKNPNVLFVRSKLEIADFFAARISPTAHFSAMDILEGQVATMVGAAWQAAGKPTKNKAEADVQLGQPSVVAGVLELGAAKTEAIGGNINALTTLFALRDAAIEWKALVGSGAPYDFKVDPSTMGAPKTDHCPDAGCKNTITLCPGSTGDNCFEKDLPGNVVFAHVGAFVGFSENAIQLGSQWAQLQKSGGQHWDPPEDTNMISFAFGLPHPLTRAAFCTALQGAKPGFATHKCKDCRETTTAKPVDPPDHHPSKP